MNQNRIWQGWRNWLSANQRGWRLFVGFLCVGGLFLFLHFREVRTEVLEPNTQASRYIISQVDFEFPDSEAVIVLKQQAMQDVGKIYQFDDKQIRETRYLVEEHLVHDKGWRRKAPNSTFEEMYKGADTAETFLIETRFTDPRTLQIVRDLKIPETSYVEWIIDSEEPRIPPSLWESLRAHLEKSFHRETIDYIVNSYQSKKWNLQEDIALENSLKSQISRKVPDKYAKVSAGTKIIDQGEFVSSRHIAMLQAMKQALSEERQLKDPFSILASVLIALIFVSISALYFRINQIHFIRSLREIALFVCIILISLGLAKLTECILLKSTSSVIDAIRYPVIAPFATILICILLSPRTALFAATFLSIILSVSLAVDHSRFLVLNLVTAIVVIIYSRGIRRRKTIFIVCLKSWLSAIPVLYAFTLSEHQFFSPQFLFDVGASLAFLMATAILVVGLLPLLEMLFGILTDMTLIEYLDPSSELLKEFSATVPGTYQHSLVLGNLAETCATAIGANGLFCRAATLYHDIGKMRNPQFYTENQNNQLNIHQLLTPTESAQVIISHVTDGEEIARKHRLPEAFIDIILQHHGTTLVYYFYRKELDAKGGNPKNIDERSFRYPGPKPRTKESGIIMICDSIEAASRSMDEINEEKLTELVNTLVSEKAEDGQFDECHLTFEELGRVKKTLVNTLLLTHHVRVKYPKREKHS